MKITDLITQDLGYCCEYAFFRLYHSTSLIAARLGVTERAVRYHKARFKCRELACEHKEKCLRGKFTAATEANRRT